MLACERFYYFCPAGIDLEASRTTVNSHLYFRSALPGHGKETGLDEAQISWQHQSVTRKETSALTPVATSRA